LGGAARGQGGIFESRLFFFFFFFTRRRGPEGGGKGSFDFGGGGGAEQIGGKLRPFPFCSSRGGGRKQGIGGGGDVFEKTGGGGGGGGPERPVGFPMDEPGFWGFFEPHFLGGGERGKPTRSLSRNRLKSPRRAFPRWEPLGGGGGGGKKRCFWGGAGIRPPEGLGPGGGGPGFIGPANSRKIHRGAI